MPVYKSPGVYVEEVKSAVQPIAGVGTSTAGFIGVVANSVAMPELPDGSGNKYTKVPAGEPHLVTSWEEFKKKFGDVQAGNRELSNAAYGFFNNGGTRCWVTRITTLAETGSPPVDEVQDALAAYEAIDEIALVAVPMPTDVGAGVDNLARRVAIRQMVYDHCENAGDRFAVLDGEETVNGNLVPEEVYPNAAGDGTSMGPSSLKGYGAVYFPWIDVSGTGDYVPPCGHVAGIYARVDASRGVHKAPANEVIRGALGGKYLVSRALQEELNVKGVNVLRPFNGNYTVWGARTIGGNANTEWKYVNVRRLFLFLRESIEEGTRWVVFEPNDPGLWAKITRNVTAFLTNVWRSGALFGSTPQEAFYVRCDHSTNPPEVRDLGQVVTEIGVAVVKPAEFVVFRVSQWAGGGG